MSLLPHLREIPKQIKLAVRLKLQNVIIAEQTENYNNTVSSNNTLTPTFYVNSSNPPITSYYTNQPEYYSSNGSSNIENTISCGQTNINLI